MTIKDLIVSIDPSPTGAQRRQVAGDLARRFKARLTGYYVGPTAGRHAEEVADAEEQQFQDELKQGGLDGRWLLSGDPIADDVAEQIKTADLAVLGLGNPDSSADDPQGFRLDGVIVACGRPVLGLPIANVPGEIGRDVLVAWDGSGGAARSMHDALPLLKTARCVTVLSVAADDRAWESARSATAHLLRHGVPATASGVPGGGMDTGQVILAHCEHLRCDLIVAGAYGHARLRESVLGGVSRTLLRQMMVPVLMSH